MARRIKKGPYHFRIRADCRVTYLVVLRRLGAIGVSKDDFDVALSAIWGEFNQGFVPVDGLPVRNEPGTYAFTVHNVRLHYQIDETLMEIAVVRIMP